MAPKLYMNVALLIHRYVSCPSLFNTVIASQPRVALFCALIGRVLPNFPVSANIQRIVLYKDKK